MVSKDKVKLSFKTDVSIIMPKTILLVSSELIFWGYERLCLRVLFSVYFLVHKFALFRTRLQWVGGIDVYACCIVLEMTQTIQ